LLKKVDIVNIRFRNSTLLYYTILKKSEDVAYDLFKFAPKQILWINIQRLHATGKGNNLQIVHFGANWIKLKVVQVIYFFIKELFANAIKFAEIRKNVVAFKLKYLLIFT